jgi:hypothetical protein
MYRNQSLLVYRNGASTRDQDVEFPEASSPNVTTSFDCRFLQADGPIPAASGRDWLQAQGQPFAVRVQCGPAARRSNDLRHGVGI